MQSHSRTTQARFTQPPTETQRTHSRIRIARTYVESHDHIHDYHTRERKRGGGAAFTAAVFRVCVYTVCLCTQDGRIRSTRRIGGREKKNRKSPEEIGVSRLGPVPALVGVAEQKCFTYSRCACTELRSRNFGYTVCTISLVHGNTGLQPDDEAVTCATERGRATKTIDAKACALPAPE